jgi:hypothetical protein
MQCVFQLCKPPCLLVVIQHTKELCHIQRVCSEDDNKFVRQSDAEQKKMVKDLEEYKADKGKAYQGFQESVCSGNKHIKDLKAQILDFSDLVHAKEALLAMAKANASVTEKTLDEIEPKLDAFSAI